MKRLLLVFLGLVSHGAVLIVGFMLGIYVLPILMARSSPDVTAIGALTQDAIYTAQIAEDLRGNDFFHHGKGTITLTRTHIVHEGEIAPGPDYVVYLVPEFVEHEDEFLPLQSESRLIGRVDAFEGFAIEIPEDAEIDNYTTVLVWCITFGEFILAAQYQ